ncbi:hypothetical protein [Niabella hibiscisoli]|uniref:hypothetical protein n=1 Tax=Niabella hibiscisoli TaxID=1825928 RepID=UPI001F0FB510|nr:hypothetical protein [Niabella hibiscisoli]MCH5715696.1 hypothetical protein [Niabella hibiscisoli]
MKWLPAIAVFFLLQPLIWIQMGINLFNGDANIINYHSDLFIKEVNSTIAQGVSFK